MMELKLHDDSRQEQDDRTPQILYGQTAHEHNVTIIEGATAAAAAAAAAAEQLTTTTTTTTTNDDSIMLTLKLPITRACWKTDADVEFDNVPGMAFVTDDALLFQCSQNVDYSVAMDAECILLHAQAEDDCVLYLQLSSETSNLATSSGEEVMELTLTLESAADCQRLFDALSQLVSLHPIHDDANDADADNGGMMMMMMGNGHEENYGDDMVVAQQQLQQQQQPLGDSAEEERNAMLDRLDTMLVVPPHLEQNGGGAAVDDEGQFDDAEDDVDELL